MEIAKKTLQMVREHLPPSGTKIGEYVFLGSDDLWIGTVGSLRPFVTVAEDRWPMGGGFLLIVMIDGPVYIAELDSNDTAAKLDDYNTLDLRQDNLVDYCATDFPKFMEIMRLYTIALETTPNPDDVFDEKGYERLEKAGTMLRQQIEKIDSKAVEDMNGFWSTMIEELGSGMW